MVIAHPDRYVTDFADFFNMSAPASAQNGTPMPKTVTIDYIIYLTFN